MSILKRLDNLPVSRDPSDIRLFAKIRNEAEMLPHFLKYYRTIGVNRFIIMTNNCDDDTEDYLLAQKDVHVLQYNRSRFRNRPFDPDFRELYNEMLEEYNYQGWCLFADADERILHPLYEKMSLRQYLREMEERGFESMTCSFVDMYSDLPVRDVSILIDPMESCRYFDSPRFYFTNKLEGEVRDRYTEKLNGGREISNSHYTVGGTYSRFYKRDLPLKIKTPIFKYVPRKTYIGRGHHFISNSRLCPSKGAVLHYCFTNLLIDKCKRQEKEGVYYKKSVIYRGFNNLLQKNPNLSFYQEDISHEVSGSLHLMATGLMRT